MPNSISNAPQSGGTALPSGTSAGQILTWSGSAWTAGNVEKVVNTVVVSGNGVATSFAITFPTAFSLQCLAVLIVEDNTNGGAGLGSNSLWISGRTASGFTLNVATAFANGINFVFTYLAIGN